MNIKSKIIPSQVTSDKSDKSDHKFAVMADSHLEAYKIFKESILRLLDVNEWNKLCGVGSAVFTLTDEEGCEINELIQQGRFIKIDIPDPGPDSGNGFDWVYIEKTESRKITDSKECFAVSVRPTSNPLTSNITIAHFFKKNATSTFMVCIDGNIISASIHGRNETPNTKTTNTLDNIRNKVVASSALALLSDVQWNNLVRGIVKGTEV
jgi:hypothetical protein